MQRLVDIAPAQIPQIWALLSQIPDPEVPVLNITDLGMVRSVKAQGKAGSSASRQPIRAVRQRSICWGDPRNPDRKRL